MVMVQERSPFLSSRRAPRECKPNRLYFTANVDTRIQSHFHGHFTPSADRWSYRIPNAYFLMPQTLTYFVILPHADQWCVPRSLETDYPSVSKRIQTRASTRALCGGIPMVI